MTSISCLKALWFLLVAMGGAACGPGPDAGSEPSGLSAELRTVDEVRLSDDGRQVTLQFVGSALYVEDDPCTARYEGWARPTDDDLEVAVSIHCLEHLSGCEGASGDVGCTRRFDRLPRFGVVGLRRRFVLMDHLSPSKGVKVQILGALELATW
jgi:hypothetical protein